jgi:hypothetical protein
MEELLLGSRKLPTPVLSGSGSRVFLSPAILRSTPVSIAQLKHCGQEEGKWRARRRRDESRSSEVTFSPTLFRTERGKGWGTVAIFLSRIKTARQV